jgi:ABC-2 type transport system ATP-binding protein
MVNIESLSFGYGRGALFKELSLGLTPGNIYGLLGVNGAGKSTLLKLMSGLLFPAGGSVRSLNQNPAERRPSFLLDVFVLAEDAQAPNMLARDFIRTRAPFYPRFDHALFERHLREFELPSAAGNLATLSHGQQKKFLLAFGLASQAKLILLDEPTNGLDIPSKSLLRRVIAEAVNDERVFVISTHQVRDLGTLMDPIVILHQGRVLLNRTLGEISARLHMTQQPSPPSPDTPNLLFSEPAVGGFWSVWRGGGDGPLDLEVLFNAIVAKPQLAQTEFAATGGAA